MALEFADGEVRFSDGSYPRIEVSSEGYWIKDANGQVVKEIRWAEEEELVAAGAQPEEEGAEGSDWECLECGASPESIWWCLAQAWWLAARRTVSWAAAAWAYLIGKDN